MSAEPTPAPGTAELVANFLAVVSIAASFLALFWNPLRLSPVAILLALISVAMAPKSARLPLAAVVVGTICFIAGMTIAVTTKNPLY